jgi:Uncharacterized conserved protein (DUF2190)
MAATDFVWGRTPIQGADVPYLNTSGAAIAAGTALKLDTGNPISATQPQIGMIPTTAITDFVDGFAVENVPIGGQGRVQIEGIAVGIASAAIAIGAVVGASATAGKVVAYTATDPSIGKAWSAAANANDPVLIRIAPSRNA